MYIGDGYGNRRVIVVDVGGKYEQLARGADLVR
jgi:hypothetical protein